MKKFYQGFISKIRIVFLMALIFGVLCGRSAYAADTYTENLIPKMIGYTANGITVSASGEYDGRYLAWKAFDRIACGDDIGKEHSWASARGTSKGWIKVDFGVTNQKNIEKYTIKCRKSNDNSNIKSWTFDGSMDGTSWVALDTKTNEINWDYSNSEKREYIFANDKEYRYYRINVLANNGQSNWIDIDEIELMEKEIPVIQSMSISLNKTLAIINVGQDETLTATITPDNATNKTVIWKSNHPEITTVDITGKITAVTTGTAIITATTQDGSNLSASCIVTVTDKVVQPPTDNTGNAILTITM
ncbi:discoidin domain-containing protein, partial [Clostridium sp. CF012]|uniref:discoidin domain-containing protein n=1 Tax=Clostridium sp. CF012 TaxID=2843319 RepID=UPI001C0E174F